MKIKLIAVDLDGTLLNSKKEVSPKTLKALKRAHAMGAENNSFSGRKFVQTLATGNALLCQFSNQLGIVNKRS